MPDLLIYLHDQDQAFLLEAAAKSKGLRTKCVFNSQVASEWLQIKSFDVLVISPSLEIFDQQSLGELLWGKNFLAALVIYDPSGTYQDLTHTVRLFGAELALGTNAQAFLDKVLPNRAQLERQARDETEILVVEDLDAPRDIICAYVERLGFSRVSGESSAAAALKRLEATPQAFSCVLTDIRMPQMTGDELIRVIRSKEALKHIPVIVLTAYGTVDCLIGSLKAGASGFLVKPPKKSDLLREISRALRHYTLKEDPRLVQEADLEAISEAIRARGMR